MLNVCLGELNINVDPDPSFEKCYVEFERISHQLQTMKMAELIARPMPIDSNLSVVGAVLIEMISAAFWTCRLTVSKRPIY
jgi:hypothetical protein